MILGFGYDSKNNDHKIVKLSSWYSRVEEKIYSSKVEVYSLKKECWGKMRSLNMYFNSGGRERQAFMNGSIHWLGHKNKERRLDGSGILVDCVFQMPDSVVSFDVSSEEIKVFSLPMSRIAGGERLYREMRVDVYNGDLLCVIYSEDGFRFDIWVMEKYGVVEGSWNRVRSVQLPSTFGRHIDDLFLGFGMNGELIFYNSKGLTVFYPASKGNREEFKNVQLDQEYALPLLPFI